MKIFQTDLDENARAVVDVFSGKADNLPIEVERADGKRRIIIRQGNESKAGTKHSLFRHFGTRSNYIEIDEIAMIPEIIAKGERVVTGKRVEYNYETAEGPCLRVTTEISKNNREVFSNFISNKKTLQSEYRQAQKGNTHLSAQTTDAEVMGTKVSENSENSAKDNVKYSKEWKEGPKRSKRRGSEGERNTKIRVGFTGNGAEWGGGSGRSRLGGWPRGGFCRRWFWAARLQTLSRADICRAL